MLGMWSAATSLGNQLNPGPLSLQQRSTWDGYRQEPSLYLGICEVRPLIHWGLSRPLQIGDPSAQALIFGYSLSSLILSHLPLGTHRRLGPKDRQRTSDRVPSSQSFLILFPVVKSTSKNIK